MGNVDRLQNGQVRYYYHVQRGGQTEYRRPTLFLWGQGSCFTLWLHETLHPGAVPTPAVPPDDATEVGIVTFFKLSQQVNGINFVA